MLQISTAMNTKKFRSLSTSSYSRLFLIKPIASYINCDVMKKDIFTTARNQIGTGVYCWLNNYNNKCYVGSSINFTMRLYKYYSLKHLHDSKTTINSALLKYGYSSFSLHILEYCDKNESIKREQHYIDLLKPEYNMLKKAGSSLGFKHSKSTLETMRSRDVSAITKNNGI